ncbi:MAG: hypothetical protein QM765_09345 [Myxococcales bacterium]
MRRLRPAGLALAVTVLAGAFALVPVDFAPAKVQRKERHVSGVDLSGYSTTPPAGGVDFLFIHHSCGGQWLADAATATGTVEDSEAEAPCIYPRHAHGGDLRARLEANGYRVHEASYGSEIGERTDLYDWLPKFRRQMDRVLRTDRNDRLLPEDRRNRIVAFKSCFPNSDFVGRGLPPGNPEGPELTVANAQATLRELLPELAKQPDVLFVYVTAPPLASGGKAPAWKHLARTARRVWQGRLPVEESGALAREFNDWVKSPDGWLRDYPLRNVVVFDYFDVLTGGLADVAAFPSAGGDSHPSSEGNRRATEEFVPFLARAWHRAGMER